MNEGEALMVLRLLEWLMAEGHAPESITVIAAYSQQVRRIRELVKARPHLTTAAHNKPATQGAQAAQAAPGEAPAARLGGVRGGARFIGRKDGGMDGWMDGRASRERASERARRACVRDD